MEQLIELWRQFMAVSNGAPTERHQDFNEYNRLSDAIKNKMKELQFSAVSLGFGSNKSRQVLDTIKANFEHKFLFKNDYFEFYLVAGLLVRRQQIINLGGPNPFYTFVVGTKKDCADFKKRVKACNG